ncbi:MAG: OsmC family protein [Acidimicrobiia bacterium]|nr:OsmC family protein [Acidimicrobiia bacterium]
MPVPPLSLQWHGDFKFSNAAGFPPIQLDSGDPHVPSPMQALAYGLMGCMAMDVVLILQKGRHDLKALSVHFEGDRAETQPKRYTRMHVRFDVTGAVPEEAVARAIKLSHETYCSVSNSLRQDIDFTTSFTITA